MNFRLLCSAAGVEFRDASQALNNRCTLATAAK